MVDLLTKVQDLLKVLVQDVQNRGLGRTLDDVEKVCLLLGSRFKYLCMTVCLNGGNDLENEVRALVEYKFSSFSGTIAFSAGSVGTVGAEMIKAREAPKQERQALNARGGRVGGHRRGSRGPACYVQDGQDQSGHNKKVVRPAGDVDVPELRKDAALSEMAAYMKEAAPKNDSKFDFLQYWEAQGTG